MDTDQPIVIRAGKIVTTILELGLKSIPIYLGHGKGGGIKSLYQILEEMDAKTRYRYKQQLKHLEQTGYIDLGGEHVKLTQIGRQFVELHTFPEIPVENWHGVWHIVSYDVPNHFNRERTFFRGWLKEWGFYRLHKSTWVIPYECKQQVAIVCQELKIAPYVLYLNATELPIEKKLVQHFQLSV